jgi:P pilus assembly chaperone PapD
MKRKNISIFFSLLILWLSTRWLSAAILVSPVRFEIEIVPGKSDTEAVRVRNLGNSEQTVNIYASDFQLDEEGALSFPEEGTLEDSILPWLRVNPSFLTLRPNEEKWIRFTVSLPEDSEKELQGMIFFQTVPQGTEKAKEKQVFISARLGVVVYASPKRKAKKLAEISDFLLKENLKDASLEYVLFLVNQGNVHFRPKGTVTLRDGRGEKIASNELNPKAEAVLSGTHRIFEGKIGLGLKPDSYRVIAEVDYGGRTNLEGEKAIHFSSEATLDAFEAKWAIPRAEKKGLSLETDTLSVKESEGGLQVSISAAGLSSYKYFELSDPPRLVIDLKGVDSQSFPESFPVNSHKVVGLRTSQFQAFPEKILRIAIDFQEKQNYRVRRDGEKVTIDIENVESSETGAGNRALGSQPGILFWATAKGSNLYQRLDRTLLRIKDSKGEILTEVPLRVKAISSGIELEGEWEKSLPSGIYFAELAIFSKDQLLLSSFLKLKRKG